MTPTNELATLADVEAEIARWQIELNEIELERETIREKEWAVRTRLTHLEIRRNAFIVLGERK